MRAGSGGVAVTHGIAVAGLVTCAGFVGSVLPVEARADSDARLIEIEKRLAEQTRQLARQEAMIEAQRRELMVLRVGHAHHDTDGTAPRARQASAKRYPRKARTHTPPRWTAPIESRQVEAFLTQAAVNAAALHDEDTAKRRMASNTLPVGLAIQTSDDERPLPEKTAASVKTAPPDDASDLASKRAAFGKRWLADTTGGERQSTNDAPEDARNTPTKPVGEAPPPSEPQVRAVAALPEQVGVLTPRGQWVFTPSLEYVHSSANRLVFRGVEIVPGIQLGVIEANEADRNSAVSTAALRYGVTRRLEVEARLPYVDRFDRVTTVAQRNETVSQSRDLKGRDIGDAELALRYQLNAVRPGSPVYVANLRVKSPTGKGPYDVRYDEFGVAQGLATGSGFWAAEGGVTVLYPTDPAVIFASLSYLHNVPRNVNKTIGTAVVGRVEPGDSIGASLGFGLSLNPRFSVSFGYSHNYIARTRTQLNGTWQKSQSLQVGSLLMGWSFRLTDRMTLSNNFQFGVTSDAPDMEAIVSLPIRF